ncbi:hypothetical protein CSUI_007671 [Cystoisospora suis]|uniref:Uncharacterized protein n=1 Tax=Cystoisospora suis TaxID=483139 RepID=A0A2C6KLV0_9APIC|nr:hypothetical protein CSUI_007671 [Cystoisospora suis]
MSVKKRSLSKWRSFLFTGSQEVVRYEEINADEEGKTLARSKHGRTDSAYEGGCRHLRYVHSMRTGA